LYKRFAQNLAKFFLTKNLAEHWDLPNTGIFYSKDVASVDKKERNDSFEVSCSFHQQFFIDKSSL
jgi:hypothetical protein